MASMKIEFRRKIVVLLSKGCNIAASIRQGDCTESCTLLHAVWVQCSSLQVGVRYGAGQGRLGSSYDFDRKELFCNCSITAL